MGNFLTPVIDKAKKMYNDAAFAVSPTVQPNELGGKAQILKEYNDAVVASKPGLTPVSTGAGDVMNPSAKYGDKPGEKRIDTTDMLKPLGRYAGGTARVPETGPYILEEGEKVVPADENPDNQPGAPVDFGGPVLSNPDNVKPMLDTDSPVENPRLSGGAKMSTQLAPVESPKMDTSNPHAADVQQYKMQTVNAPHTLTGSTKMAPVPGSEEQGPMPVAAEKPKEPKEPEVKAPDPFQILKLQAAAKGDLVGLGSAIIAERIANPASIAGDIKPAEYGGPVAKGTEAPKTGQLIPATDEKKDERIFAQEDYQGNLKSLKQGIQKALGAGDLEKAGQLERALVEMQRQNPYGSETNHPGVLGKIEHGLGVAGNIAGEVFAPSVMPIIPGSQANLRARTEGANEDITTGAQEKLAQAEAEKNRATANNTSTNQKLFGQLLTKGYVLSSNAQGEPTLTQVPGFRDAPKDTQAGYAAAVQDALDNGADPATDPKVQHWADAITSLQKQSSSLQEKNKQAFQDTVAKIAGKYSTDPKDLDDSLEAARNEKLISEAEYTKAKSYQSVNPNAATTLTIKNEAGDEAAKHAIDKMFTGKMVTVQAPDGGTAQMPYSEAVEKGYPQDQMSIVQPGQAEKNKTEVANAIDTKKAMVEYYNDFLKYGPKLTNGDREILGTLQRNEAKTSGELGGLIGDIPVLGPISDATNREMHAWMLQNGYKNLSEGGKKLMSDYFNSIIANFADMKRRLGGIGRNDSMILAEMHTIPMGNVDVASAKPVFQAKLKSLDERNRFLPRIDGKHPNDIRPEPQHPVGTVLSQGNKYYKVLTVNGNGDPATTEETDKNGNPLK